MATTVTMMSAPELRAELAILHTLLDQAVALQDRIESKALELSMCDWGEELNDSARGRRYINALSGQLRAIYMDADPERRSSEWDPEELAGDVEAAIAILDLAIAKGGDGAP